MGYDRGHSFAFDFEPNRIPFGSKLKGNVFLSIHSFPFDFILIERKFQSKSNFNRKEILFFIKSKGKLSP